MWASAASPTMTARERERHRRNNVGSGTNLASKLCSEFRSSLVASPWQSRHVARQDNTDAIGMYGKASSVAKASRLLDTKHTHAAKLNNGRPTCSRILGRTTQNACRDTATWIASNGVQGIAKGRKSGRHDRDLVYDMRSRRVVLTNRVNGHDEC